MIFAIVAIVALVIAFGCLGVAAWKSFIRNKGIDDSLSAITYCLAAIICCMVAQVAGILYRVTK